MNEMMQKFCVLFAENGGQGAAAARGVGYKQPKQQAWTLLQRKDIQERIVQEAKRVHMEFGVKGLKALADLLDTTQDERLKFQIALELKNGAGLRQSEKIEIAVTDQRSDEELLKLIQEQAPKLMNEYRPAIEGELDERVS